MAVLKADLEHIRELWSALDVPQPLQAAAPYLRKMHAEPLEAYVNRVARVTSGGGVALDAGCGTATWSFALSNFFDQTIAIDRSRVRVDAARWLVNISGNKRIEASYGDTTELSIPDESVDFVFCYGVVIAGLSLRAVMREFHRVTKKGGVIYVCTNGLGWSNYLRDERGSTSPKDRIAGIRSIYNTLCTIKQFDASERISRLVASVSADGEIAERVAKAIDVSPDKILGVIASLGVAKELSELEVSIGNWTSSVDALTTTIDKMLAAAGIAGVSIAETAREIEIECGEEFKLLYGNDILALVAGRRAIFSHASTGRGRYPGEAESVCNQLGLIDFRYAGEGELVGYSGSDVAAPSFFPSEFGGQQAVWEFMVRKPE